MKTYPISVYRALKKGDIRPFLEKLEDYDTVRSYGEPGYDEPDEGSLIIFAYWNDVPTAIQELLEDLGHHLEWMDEWVIDGSRSIAYRTSPSSMWWSPSYFIHEGEVYGSADKPDTLINIMRTTADTMYLDVEVASPNLLNHKVLTERGWKESEPVRWEDRQQEVERLLESDSIEAVIVLEGEYSYEVLPYFLPQAEA